MRFGASGYRLRAANRNVDGKSRLIHPAVDDTSFIQIPGTPPLTSAHLLDQVQERVRYLHYSLKTEKAYLYWIRFFNR
jgi:hypothetical protein